MQLDLFKQASWGLITIEESGTRVVEGKEEKGKVINTNKHMPGAMLGILRQLFTQLTFYLKTFRENSKISTYTLHLYSPIANILPNLHAKST